MHEVVPNAKKALPIKGFWASTALGLLLFLGVMLWVLHGVPVGRGQALYVKVRLTPDGGCKVLRWETAYAGDWGANGTIDIWDGDF